MSVQNEIEYEDLLALQTDKLTPDRRALSLLPPAARLIRILQLGTAAA